jgi:hypothetical protein
MAEIFYKSMNRRSFIKTGLAAAGTLVTIGTHLLENFRIALLNILICTETFRNLRTIT